MILSLNNQNYWTYTKQVPLYDKVEVKGENKLSFYKDNKLIKTVNAVRLDKKNG